MLFISYQVSQDEIDKYAKVAMPTKDSLHPDMDKFSFMPRISFAETDSIKVFRLFLSIILSELSDHFGTKCLGCLDK